LAFQLSFDLDINNTILAMAYQQAGDIAGFDGAALFSQDLVRSAPTDGRVTVPGFLQSIGGIMLSAVAPQTASANLGDNPAASSDASMSVGQIDPISVELAKNYRDKISTVPLLRDALNRRDNDVGSNTWAVSGEFTASGYPLFANDPHLSLSFPSVFTEEHLIYNDIDVSVSGVAVPGAPGIIQGCNNFLCWGTTVHPMDVTDTYQETLVTNGLGLPVATVFQGEQEPLLAVFQSYFVNDASDGNANSVSRANVGYTQGGITFIVPRRNNGPLVQVDGNAGLSVQYTGWGPTFELEAFRRINRASNQDEFVAALQFFDVGSQNFMVADVDGNIAYYTSAENPIRADLQNDMAPDGGIPPFLIRDGSGTLNHEWLPVQNPQPNQALPFEIMPFSEMPQAMNPASGYLANANNDPIGVTLDNNPLNQIRPGGGLYYLNPGYADFRQGRIDRVLQELTAEGNITTEDMIALQANNQLLDAELMVPFIISAAGSIPALCSAVPQPDFCNPLIAETIERLSAWDFSTPTGIPGGFDPGDLVVANTVVADPAPPGVPNSFTTFVSNTVPSEAEIDASIAATIFAAWRGEIIANSVDTLLGFVGLDDFAPGSRASVSAVYNQIINAESLLGRGASGLPILSIAVSDDPSDARLFADSAILNSLASALELLASDEFAPAFNNSTNLEDYRWGLLHRIVFDHPLNTDPFNVPNGGGFSDVSSELPGVARAGGFESVDAAAHSARANSVNEFMFGNGPARRFVGSLTPSGPVGLEVIPGGRSSVVSSPHYADQLPLWLSNDFHGLTLGTEAAQAGSVNVIIFSPTDD